MRFQAVTTWSAVPFELEIRHGHFSEREAANDAAARFQSLAWSGSDLVATTPDGVRQVIADDAIAVRKIKASAMERLAAAGDPGEVMRNPTREVFAKFAIHPEDLEEVPVTVAQLAAMRETVSELRTFGSQAFGAIPA